jgi:hypothetical protein
MSVIHHGFFVFESAYPDFRALQIAQQGYMGSKFSIERPYAFNYFEVLAVCSMRKIQPEHINPGFYKFTQHFAARTGGPYGSNYFCFHS